MGFPEPTNLTSPQLFATYLNTVTDNWFWGGSVLGIFVILLIAFSSRFPKEDALAVASFTCLIITMVARAMGLVNDLIMYFFASMVILSFVLLYTRGKVIY